MSKSVRAEREIGILNIPDDMNIHTEVAGRRIDSRLPTPPLVWLHYLRESYCTMYPKRRSLIYL